MVKERKSMGKLAGVVAALVVVAVVSFSFSGYSFGQESFPASNVSDEVASAEGTEGKKEIKDPWLAYLREILSVTLSETENLIQIKKGAKEQQSLGEIKVILEEDIYDIENGLISSIEDVTTLEYHHESINLILEAIRKVPDEGEDSSVAKAIE